MEEKAKTTTYTVKEGAKISLAGKQLAAGASVELTEEQYAVMKDLVTSKEGSAAAKTEDETPPAHESSRSSTTTRRT